MRNIKQIVLKNYANEAFSLCKEELNSKTDVSVIDLDDLNLLWNTVLVFIEPVADKIGGVMLPKEVIFERLVSKSVGYLAVFSEVADVIGVKEDGLPERLSDILTRAPEIGNKVYFNPRSGVIYRDQEGNAFRMIRIQDVTGFCKNVNLENLNG